MSNRTRESVFALTALLLLGCGVGRPWQTDQQRIEERCKFVARTYEIIPNSAKPFAWESNKPCNGTDAKTSCIDPWYAWNDHTVGVPQATASLAMINPGANGKSLGVCEDSAPGHTIALVLKAYGFNDYGGGFGVWGGPDYRDLSDWDGLGIWVRVPQGADPAMAFRIADAQTDPPAPSGLDTKGFVDAKTGKKAISTATRQCCGGAAATAEGNCVDQSVPLPTCFNGGTTTTDARFPLSWTNACTQYQTPRGSTCTAWKIVPMLTNSEIKRGMTASSIPAFDVSACGKPNQPDYVRMRCVSFAALSGPFVCASASPPPAVSCDDWSFLLQATTDGSWSYQVIPFDTLMQSGNGRVFDKFDKSQVVFNDSRFTQGVQGGGAAIEFWIDEIGVYRVKK